LYDNIIATVASKSINAIQRQMKTRQEARLPQR